MIKSYYIYTHARKNDGRVFYVGCATWQHKRRGEKSKYQRAYDFGQRTTAWFHESTNGVEVKIVFTTAERSKAFSVERQLIAKYGRADLGRGLLVNQTDGGAGAGGQIATEQSKRKKAISKIGRLNPMFGRTGALSSNRRQVSDISNARTYATVTEAANATGMPMKSLYNMLSGFRKNRTSLRFA